MRRRIIAIVGARGIANYGGFETVVAELAPRLQSNGYEVVCSARMSGTSVEDEVFKGVRVIHFPFRFPRSNRTGRLLEVLYDWYFLVRCSLFLRCDVVYCLGIAGGPILLLARSCGAATVVNLDGLEWKRPKFKMVERIYIRIAFLSSCIFSDRLILDNRKLMDFIPESVKPKAVFIPYGVSPRDRLHWDPSLPAKYVSGRSVNITSNGFWLVVARLEPDNNIHTIIEAYSRSKSRKPMIVVGSFSSLTYEESVTSIVSAMPAGKEVVFLGSVFDQVHLTMLRCNCFAYIHGHSVGGTNPSLLEAMSWGNMILAHDNVFNRDVSEGNALFFRGVDDLANEMDLVDQAPERYTHLGTKVDEIARTRYRWDDVASAYDDLFKNL